MTTLTIEIPDSESSIINDIIGISKNAGLKVTIQNDEGALSEEEFEKLRTGLEEAVLIKKGLSKYVPSSQLWND